MCARRVNHFGGAPPGGRNALDSLVEWKYSLGGRAPCLDVATISPGGVPFCPSYDNSEVTAKLVKDWVKLPQEIYGGFCNLSTDSQDRVYIFRLPQEPPVVVYDREGNGQSSMDSTTEQIAWVGGPRGLCQQRPYKHADLGDSS